MNDHDLEKLKYPIGRFQPLDSVDEKQIEQWISALADFPGRLANLVANLNDQQLNLVYRQGGWSIRQVIHHLADSHINAYVRVKLAITENNPHIRPYDEASWAECEEARLGDIAVSLALLANLHQRWALFLSTLKFSDFDRIYFHPEHQKTFNLKYLLGLYVWHGEHHLAHISGTLERHH